MEEEDYILSNSTLSSLAALAAAAIAALFLFHSLANTHVLSLIFFSNINLLYRHFMVNMEGPIALKHGMNCGTIHASTCLVVGYCHKWQYPNREKREERKEKGEQNYTVESKKKIQSQGRELNQHNTLSSPSPSSSPWRGRQ